MTWTAPLWTAPETQPPQPDGLRNTETGELLTQADAQLLTKWEAAKTALAAAKQVEIGLRTRMLTRFFVTKPKGTENFPLSDGRKLKCVFALSYNIDQTQLSAALDKLEELDPQNGELCGNMLIEWKGSLNVKIWDTLPPAYKNCFADALEIKPASPQLSMDGPK